MKTKAFYNSSTGQQNPNIYDLINHSTSDIENIPLDHNFLIFRDKKTERKYLDHLFFDHESNNQPSAQFKSNIFIFFIYYTLFFLSSLTYNILKYYLESFPEPIFFIKTFFLGICSIAVYIILYLIIKSKRVYKNSLKATTFIGTIIVFNLIITDNRVLVYITGKHIDEVSVNSLLIFILLGYLKNQIFGTFRCMLWWTIFTICTQVFVLIMFSQDLITDAYEVFGLSVGLLLECVICYRCDHISRDMFWKRKSQLSNTSDVFDESNDDNFSSQLINTEIELLIQLCDKIKKSIKSVFSLILYNDIKSKLKISINQLNSLKKRIASDLFRASFKLENNENIDDEDKTFISQVFMQMSLKHSNTMRKPRGIRQVSGYKLRKATFTKYGIDNLDKALDSIGNNWNFDIWLVYNVTGQSIGIVSRYVCNKWGLCQDFSIDDDTFDHFFESLEKNYHQNPYHNACHAADVMHSFLFFCIAGDLVSFMNSLETLSCIIATLAHDVRHPSVTNRFLIRNRDEIATKYNDVSVLENMHANITFTLMAMEGFNILENLTQDEWIKARKIIIELILETDMSRHFELLGRFRARITNLEDFNLDIIENKIMLWSTALKCADIGHSAKIAELHERWSALICEEFFRQGDIEKERKQEISMYCDRHNTDIPKSQAGFIKNISLPMYESWCSYLKSEKVNHYCLDQLKINYESWTAKIITMKSPENRVFSARDDEEDDNEN
ncbi:hypothetical protein SteCoe_27766 [Stentor coeruleus]|uniref:PDEase domain-containing protein n=1 Tax=Stentor coeruleus TaxID=5963 RepID=A0A1R2B9P5_9CILI|nr:hypothetical protein SteCoe_27766 [Stentor coeruleus]